MRSFRLCAVLSLALAAGPARAIDAGVVTIADGTARLLRGTAWFRLVPGVVFQDGDVLDAGERSTIQIEGAAIGTVNLVGPASMYAATIAAAPGGREASELGFERGWAKLAVAAPGAGLRVRTPDAVVTVTDAIAVLHQDAHRFEAFIESGSAKLGEAGRTGRDAAVDAKAGDYWLRDGDRPFTSERRAPPRFVAAMPRALTDRIVSLAPRFKGKPAPALKAERDITFAEAEPWLTGPYRRAFAKRFAPRLADPAFRRGVEANIAAFPEFERLIAGDKPADAAAPAAPAAASAPATTATPAPAAVPPKASPFAAPALVPTRPGPRSSARERTLGFALLFPASEGVL